MRGLFETVRVFFSGKRMLVLLIFALLFGNISFYLVDRAANRQIEKSFTLSHAKVYQSYLQFVERAKKEINLSNNGPQPYTPGVGTNTLSQSPYWLALREMKKTFPQHRINVVLENSLETDVDRKLFEVIRNKPKGWTTNVEVDGWIRSVYVLPTRDIAALEVVSYLRDEVTAWQDVSIFSSLFGFTLFFAFGWFWTRSLQHTAGDVRVHLKGLGQTSQQIGDLLTKTEHILRGLANGATANNQPAMNLQDLRDALNQIKLLAVNGSLEAGRSGELGKMTLLIMSEINHLANTAKEKIAGFENKSGGGATKNTIFEVLSLLNEVQLNLRPAGVSQPSEPLKEALHDREPELKNAG
jgi:hypothetical protein